MGLFSTEVTGNSRNFEIPSRNFSFMPACMLKELLKTACDTYLKIILLASACLCKISAQEDDMPTEL